LERQCDENHARDRVEGKNI